MASDADDEGEAENFPETEGIHRSLCWKPKDCIMAVRVKTSHCNDS